MHCTDKLRCRCNADVIHVYWRRTGGVFLAHCRCTADTVLVCTCSLMWSRCNVRVVPMSCRCTDGVRRCKLLSECAKETTQMQNRSRYIIQTIRQMQSVPTCRCNPRLKRPHGPHICYLRWTRRCPWKTCLDIQELWKAVQSTCTAGVAWGSR